MPLMGVRRNSTARSFCARFFRIKRRAFALDAPDASLPCDEHARMVLNVLSRRAYPMWRRLYGRARATRTILAWRLSNRRL